MERTASILSELWREGDVLMEAYIYRMPDGSLRIQCGNCGALLTQLRILAGQRNSKFVPARCPECGSTIVGVQGTEDWSAEDGD